LAERRASVLMVGLTRRFFPSLATACEILRSGVLGGKVEFRCYEGSVYQWPIASDAPFRREVGGGGVLMDKGVHVLDALTWMFGPMSVVGAEDDALVGGVEGNCRVTLAGKEARGVMQLSWDQLTANGLFIRGSLGEMRVDPNEFRWIEVKNAQGAWERHSCRTSWPASIKPSTPKKIAPRAYEDCIYLQWIHFLRAVAFGETVPVDGRAALSVAAQIETAYTIAVPLAQPWLSPEEQAAAALRHWRNDARK
jgi:predicted dehydrogenase